MSANNNVPVEIQEEIIKRVLSVKSLIRFRSVSKQWKTLIDSPEFITHHTFNRNHEHHILVRYVVDSKHKYVSIVDDDSFPQNKFSPYVSDTTAKLVINALMLDSPYGLVCLYGESVVNGKNQIVVWNPSIRKSVGIMLPNEEIDVVGFGVCPKTFDPKIVKITTDLDVEVLTLSSGAWRLISMNLPHKPDYFSSLDEVVIEGVIYWVAFDLLEESDFLHRIISFDLTSEEFGEVHLPDGLSRPHSLMEQRHMCVCKLKESLVVLDGGDTVCDVWMKVKNGSLFTKLFTIVKVSPYSIIGFRKNGQPIVDQMHEPDSQLQAYEPDSEHMIGLGIYGSHFDMVYYTESLLLLNHSGSVGHKTRMQQDHKQSKINTAITS